MGEIELFFMNLNRKIKICVFTLKILLFFIQLRIIHEHILWKNNVYFIFIFSKQTHTLTLVVASCSDLLIAYLAIPVTYFQDVKISYIPIPIESSMHKIDTLLLIVSIKQYNTIQLHELLSTLNLIYF